MLWRALLRRMPSLLSAELRRIPSCSGTYRMLPTGLLRSEEFAKSAPLANGRPTIGQRPRPDCAPDIGFRDRDAQAGSPSPRSRSPILDRLDATENSRSTLANPPSDNRSQRSGSP